MKVAPEKKRNLFERQRVVAVQGAAFTMPPFFLVSAQDATGIRPRRLYLGRSNKTPPAKFLLAIALRGNTLAVD